MSKPKRKKKELQLTPKQRFFVDEYMRCFNAFQAYVAAYYTQFKRPLPEKRHSVYIAANNCLKKPHVAAEVDRRIKEKQRQSQIASPIELLEGYTNAIRFDPALLVDESTGEYLPVHKLPEWIRKELTGMDYTETITEKQDGTEVTKRANIRYKFPDKLKARDSLADKFGIGKNGNGLKEMLIQLLQEHLGVTVNINQTINNDNRQLNYNVSQLEKVLELVQDGATRD